MIKSPFVLTVISMACLMAAQPVGPPVNDQISQAEWVHTYIRSRSNSEMIRLIDGSYPDGDLATKYLTSERSYDFINFTANGTNVLATMDIDEPSHGTHSFGIYAAAYRETEASVWWKWRSPINATMRLTTLGSTFDTTLGVYVRVPWDGISVSNQFGVRMVGRGDDVLWNQLLHSEVDFVAHADETYHFAVGGFRGDTGIVRLSGDVESWIYPPVIIDRVATPIFELDLFGEPQDSAWSQHSKFVTIRITCETPGAQVFYTVDGLMPAVVQTITQGYVPQDKTRRFTSPVGMGSFTIRAVAYHPSLRRSLLATSTAFQLQVIAPTISPDGGEFEDMQVVEIRAGMGPDLDQRRAVIHYTIDGSEPELTSPLFTVGFVLRNVTNMTVKARAWFASSWREDGLVPGASTEYWPGMLPSDVKASKPFTVKQRLPPVVPTIVGGTDPMVLTGGNPPLPTHAVISAASISLSLDDPLAQIVYAVSQSPTGVESWSVYTRVVSVPEVGQHWIHAFARRRGYTDSHITTQQFEVLEPITIVKPDAPFLVRLPPGAYRYHTLNLTQVGTDVTVSAESLSGSVDLFLSARQRRPSLSNHSMSATSFTAEGGHGGLRLLALHQDKELGLQVIADHRSQCPLCPFSTPIVVGVFGHSREPAQVLVRVSLDASPVIKLSHLYHGTVPIGSWRYFKLFLGQGLEPARRGLTVRVWQQPPNFVGLRIAVRRTRAPASLDLSGAGYTMFANAEGFYTFTMPVGVASREPWFVGIQGLVPVSGVGSLNFTFDVNPELEGEAVSHGRSLGPTGEPASATRLDGFGPKGVKVTDIRQGEDVHGVVGAGRFAYFRIRNISSMRWLEVRVTEAQFTGGLRIFAQEEELPSHTSHLVMNVSRWLEEGANASNISSFVYRVPVFAGKDYVIGVYGFSYEMPPGMRFGYEFKLRASTSNRAAAAQEPTIRSVGTNYRFTTMMSQSDTYSYFEIYHSNPNLDLHIVAKSALGKLDLVASNTVKYPTRTLDNVGWKSLASVEGGRALAIETADAGFKTGMFYVGIYAYATQLQDGSILTTADFGIAAFTDATSLTLEVGKSYRMRVTTYTYRYFLIHITNSYQRLRLTFFEETSGKYITVQVMKGKKPSDAENLFNVMAPDQQGQIVFEYPTPALGKYYVRVHTYKLGYSGPVLSHAYTVDVNVDDFEEENRRPFQADFSQPVSSSTAGSAQEFQSVRNQRFEQAGLPHPLPWDAQRPSTAWKVASLELGRPQTAAFAGEEWLYFTVYVPTFSTQLTVRTRALSKDLALELVLRRGQKPTLVNYIDKDDTPDSKGEYAVQASNPVTGGVYYIGIHASIQNVLGAQLVLVATVDPGVVPVPEAIELRNYFIIQAQVPALQYKFFKVFVPADERDLTISLIHFVGETDIVVSNSNPWPTKSNYNGSQPGWWKSESGMGGGKEIVVYNYDEGYVAPATFYVGVFAASSTSFYILSRLDRPPPTVPIGSVFRSNVGESAFQWFRFRMQGLIVSRLVFMVRQQRPFSSGLALYHKAGGAPTLLVYDARTDVSSANGEYFLFINQPEPSDTFYVGVFGRSGFGLERNGKYHFLGQIMTVDEYENWESSPYLADPVLVPQAGIYVPPDAASYTVLSPDTRLESQLLNNGSFQFFRLQVSEFTRVTLSARKSGWGASHYNYGPFFLLAKRLFLPSKREETVLNASYVDWFDADICSQLHNTTTKASTVTNETATINAKDETTKLETTSKTRCYASMNPSMLLSPFDNFANSSIWYVAVYAVGCRSMLACARPHGMGEATHLMQDCGCQDENPDRVEAVPFSLMTVRIPRLGMYGVLSEGQNNVTLQWPYDVDQYFIFEVNGSAAVHFKAWAGTAGGIFDLFVSDIIPYPQRAMIPPENLRSEGIFANPPVSITVLKPEGEISQVKVGVHSTSSATISIIISLSPPYYPLMMGRSYLGLLRKDKFSPTGQPRTLFQIDSQGHAGRRLALRLRPTHIRCYTAENLSLACTSSACCGGQSPYGGFNLTISADSSTGSGVYFTQSEPNVHCVEFASCTLGAPSANGSASCRDDCHVSDCCVEFGSYQIVVDAQLASRWLVSITGEVLSSGKGPRFTDSFELHVEAVDASSAQTSDGPGSVTGWSIADQATAPAAPHGRYVFQSMKQPSHLAGTRQQQAIVDVQDGETVTEEALSFGRWRIYRFLSDRPGNVSVTLKQRAGFFGLRLLLQREVLPSHEEFLTFDMTEADDTDSCTATTGIGAAACSQCTQAWCSCDKARGDVCSGKVHASVVTTQLSGDPLDGASATSLAPIYPLEPLVIAVVAESEVFAPYSFSLHVQRTIKSYHDEAQGRCWNVSLGKIFTGRVRQHERMFLFAPAFGAGHDALIRLETRFTDDWGQCHFGINDGTSCQYNSTAEVYTGRADRLYDVTCKGCSFDVGWRYVGTPIKSRFRNTINKTDYRILGHRCFLQAKYFNRFNATSKESYPFYKKRTQLQTDASISCDQQGVLPWTVPWHVDEYVDAFRVQTEQECCDRCKQVATCSFWTVTKDDDCMACEEQDVSYNDTVVQPAEANVTFIPHTGQSEWLESVPVLRVRGPHCYRTTKAQCCRLLSISDLTMVKSRIPDARVVSGGFGRCRMVSNGHVQLKVAQTAALSQSRSCASTSARAITEGLIADITEAMAPEAYADDRQGFLRPVARDPTNMSTCIQWWNGETLLDPNRPTHPVDSVVLGNELQSVEPRCIKYSSQTVRMHAKNELGRDLCLVTLGASLPRIPHLRECMDTVFRMGNGSTGGWKYYSLAHSNAGGVGAEWTYQVQDAQPVLDPEMMASAHVQLGLLVHAQGGCLVLQDDNTSVLVDACAEGNALHAHLPNKTLQEWVFMTAQGSNKSFVRSEHAKTCLTGVLACAGLHNAEEPVVLELSGILPSSFAFTLQLSDSPTLILQDRVYQAVLGGSSSQTSAAYRFVPNAMAHQGSASSTFYFVTRQHMPVRHSLNVSCSFRRVSSLALSSGSLHALDADDGSTLVFNQDQGPDEEGLQVLAVTSHSGGGGIFDCQLAVPANSSHAGDEERVNLGIWSRESFNRIFNSQGPSPLLPPSLGAPDPVHADSSILCPVLSPGIPTSCGPPKRLQRQALGVSNTGGLQGLPEDNHGSEDWWLVYHVRVREPLRLTMALSPLRPEPHLAPHPASARAEDSPQGVMNSTNSSCSARVFVLSGWWEEAALNTTRIVEATQGMSGVLVGGGASALSSRGLVLLPKMGVNVYIAIRFDRTNSVMNLTHHESLSNGVQVEPQGQHECEQSFVSARTEPAPLSDANQLPADIEFEQATALHLPWASKRFLRLQVQEAAYHIVALTQSLETQQHGTVAMFLEPERPLLPSRQHPPAPNRRVDSVQSGSGASAQGPVTFRPLVLSPDDADFELGSWIVAVFSDNEANVSVTVSRAALPPVLHLSRDYALPRPVPSSFEWRVVYQTTLARAVEVLYVETLGKSENECPLSLFARYSLPPSPHRHAWIAAAGREGGRSTLVVPPAHGDDLDAGYLVFSASMCPGGYAADDDGHCIRLRECATAAADDFSPGGSLFAVGGGLCERATNVTGAIVGANATSSPALVVPPSGECSFRFRMETKSVV